MRVFHSASCWRFFYACENCYVRNVLKNIVLYEYQVQVQVLLVTFVCEASVRTFYMKYPVQNFNVTEFLSLELVEFLVIE